jgi:Holliday junction resolvasome RuvABC ATP-dependent DNA helicase subunit
MTKRSPAAETLGHFARRARRILRAKQPPGWTEAFLRGAASRDAQLAPDTGAPPEIGGRSAAEWLGLEGAPRTEAPGAGPLIHFDPTELRFDGEPDCLFPDEGQMPYRGQEVQKKRLRLYLDTLAPDSRFKSLFTGPAGTGKTTLARIVAREIEMRRHLAGVTPGPYFEILPGQVATVAQLDALMQQLRDLPRATVFIDEVHTLTEVERFFHVLHDSGAPRYPLATGQWVEIPRSVSWMAATTDPGALGTTVGDALRRRLEPEIRLDPPSAVELAEIIMDLGDLDGIDVHPDAAFEIAQRALFPWQAKHIYGEARRVTQARGDDCLGPDAAEEAFTLIRIDEHGLTQEDRDVIHALLNAPYRTTRGKDVQVRYRLSKDALCAAAGVDAAIYHHRIQPKLLRLGLLTTVGGQSLTEKAVQLYAHRSTTD